jgi:hypothetical protein
LIIAITRFQTHRGRFVRPDNHPLRFEANPRFRSGNQRAIVVAYCSLDMTTALAQPIRAASVDVRKDNAVSRRIIAGIVAVSCAVLLGVAAWLTPSPTGLGTHGQLHLPSCGWITLADLPCPTCGMTTAFARAADGDILGSFAAQPLGALLALATAITLLASVYIALTGSRLASAFGRVWGVRTAWLLAGTVVFSWAYKIASYRGWL